MSVLVCKIFLTYLTSLKVPLQQGDQPVNPKGNQPWIFIESTDAEAEAPDVKSWLTGQDPGAGKDWRQKEKGTTEDEMVGWHHRLNRHEFEHALGAGGQGGLACCSPWGCRVRHDWSTELTRQSWVSPQGWFNVVACQGHSCSFSSMVILKLANFWPQDAPSRSRDYTLSYLYQWERTSVTVP